MLYGDGPKARRDSLFAEAMQRLVADHPRDDEARLLYAVALLGLSQGVRSVPTYQELVTIWRNADADLPGLAQVRRAGGAP